MLLWSHFLLQQQQSIQNCFNMTLIFAGTAFNQVIQFQSNDKRFNKTIYGTQARSPVKTIAFDQTQNLIIYATSTKIYAINRNNHIQQEIATVAMQKEVLAVEYLQSKEIRFCLSDGSIFLSSYSSKKPFDMKNGNRKNVLGYKHDNFKAVTSNSARDHYLFCGFGVPPIIHNLESGLIDWHGKNVKNDYLDLQVPMRDVDAKFIGQSKSVAILHADRKLRIYDIRGTHRRPIRDIQLSITAKSQMTKMKISNSENQYFFSNDIGEIYKCDSRKDFKTLGKYKGINSSITDFHISNDNNELVASSLDSYVRIFDLESCQIIKKYYVNKPIYSLAVAFSQEGTNNQEQEGQEVELNLQDEEEEPKRIQKLKQIRKRNKVGLKYLQPREFDEPQLKKQQVIQKQWYEDLNPIDRRDFQQ